MSGTIADAIKDLLLITKVYALIACTPVDEVRGLAAADGESFSAAAPEVVSATCSVPAGSCPWPAGSRVKVHLLVVLAVCFHCLVETSHQTGQ